MLNPIPAAPWGTWDLPIAPAPVAPARPAARLAQPQPVHVTLRSTQGATDPPQLPPATFVSSEPWREQRIGAVAIYCSDGRWGDAVDELCHKCLGIPAYDRFAVPGGPAWVNEADTRRQGLCRTTHEQLEFLVKVHELKRVIFITHFGCAFYGHRFNCTAEQSVEKQLDDIRAARRIIHKWFGPIEAEGYLAMQRQGVLSFHRIDD